MTRKLILRTRHVLRSGASELDLKGIPNSRKLTTSFSRANLLTEENGLHDCA